ncbi:NAD(+) diphosphatase [Leucobacter sp. BZR 635]
MSMERVPLAGGLIDRDAATRASAELLEEAWTEAGALVLRVNGQLVPIRDPEGTLALVSTAAVAAPTNERIYLGRHEGTPVFAIAAVETPGEQSVNWLHPFRTVLELDPAERELVTMALAVVRWHESAGFSPRDGEATEVADGGWSRRTASGGELFPRTDPAVIVLITHEDRVLLGSNVLWETGRFSLLAGFVEAGESLESAVAREVFEESGMRVSDIRYVASQPWPFPRSLMLGFHASLAADQDPDAFAPDPTEISELRWFTREEVLSPQPGLLLPGTVSIAGWLLQRWAEDTPQ